MLDFNKWSLYMLMVISQVTYGPSFQKGRNYKGYVSFTYILYIYIYIYIKIPFLCLVLRFIPYITQTPE